MPKRNNELASWFNLCAQNTGIGDIERRLYRSAKPIVSFFDVFDFRRQSYTGTIATLPLAKNQINLTMSKENDENGQVTALVFGITHNPEHGDQYNPTLKAFGSV